MTVPTLAPAQEVAPPRAEPLPHGLFSAFGFRSSDRWESGVQWIGEFVDGALGIGAVQGDGTATGLPKSFSDAVSAGYGSPMVVYTSHQSSLVGFTEKELQDRLLASLQRLEEARVEQALWTGDLGNVPNFAGANGYASPANLAATPQSPLAAMMLVEQASADAKMLLVVHMSRPMALRMLSEKLIEVRNGRLITRLGLPVVAGAGYSGDLIRVTPPIVGYRGEVFTSSARTGDLFDRATNTQFLVAERAYLIAWDDSVLAQVEVSPL